MVLAAGESARMGYPKALLPLGRRTFLTHILHTLDEVKLPDPVIVVGAHAAQILLSLSDRHTHVLTNEQYHLGQLSSIRMALGYLDSSRTASLIWPVDHPAVSKALITKLIQLFEQTKAPLVMPYCKGRRGHPAVFGRQLFQELLDAPLEAGARSVVLLHQNEIALLHTEEEQTVFDIDTPEDYFRLTGETLEAALSRHSKTQE